MKLLKDARYFTSSVLISLLLVAVRSFLILRILGPAANGAWKSAMLVYTLGEFARVGVSRGLSVRVPISEGRGDLEASREAATTAGNFSLLCGYLLGIITLAASLLVKHPDLKISLLFVAGIVTVAQAGLFLEDLVVARHRFEDRAKENLLEAVVGAAGCVGLGWLFGLPGLGAGSIIASAASMFYLKRKLNYRFGLRLQWGQLVDLVKTGLPLTLAETGFEVARRLDIFLMAVVLGPVAVGFYSLSLLAMDFANMLAQRGVSQLVSPHLLREYGRTNSHHEVVSYYEVPARLFSYLLPGLLGLGAFVMPPMVSLLLPDYLPGLEAAQATLWALFFVAIHASVAPFFIAADRLPTVIRLYAVLITLGGIAQIAIMRSGAGLEVVAWGMFAILGVATTAEMLLARHSTGHSLAESLSFVASLYLPLLLAMVSKSLIAQMPLPAQWASWPQLAARMTLFLLIYSPVLLIYELRFSILRAVRHST